MMECSQDTTPVSDSKQNLYRVTSLEIFSESKVFQLFDEGIHMQYLRNLFISTIIYMHKAQVKFSWLDPCSALEDIDLHNPSMLILSEFKVFYLTTLFSNIVSICFNSL